MPNPEGSPSLATVVLVSLGYALFRRSAGGGFSILGNIPDWLKALWPWLEESNRPMPIGDHSPFLQNFLFDADACWRLGGDHWIRSGPWFETGLRGATSHLEATALTAAGESILLLQRLGSDFLDRHFLVQTAREKVVAHQRVQLEMQKKEILLHCLAEDLTAGLSNITMALQLIELEERPTQVRHLLNLAAIATREQQSLIHRVLSHFTAEVDGLYGSSDGTAGMGTDLGEAWQRALALVSPEFAEHGVSLSPPEAPLTGVRVLAPAGSLERVLASLLENARQNTPPGETVRIQCEVQSNRVEVRVEDPGEWRPAELNEKPFARSDHETAPLGPTALRLQFCRIVIENCQGEIECRPGSAGGNCFWFRLPRMGPTG